MKIKNARTVLGPSGAHPSIIYAAEVVDRGWRKIVGQAARVTGLAEEGHSRTSLHYGIPGDPRSRAIDFDADVHALRGHRQEIDAWLHERLSPEEFDWVWEKMGHASAHLHLEFDPK